MTNSVELTELPPSVLIVDDNPVIRTVLAANFKRMGIETFEIGRADEAIPFLYDHAVDLVVLDIMLPGMSGTELLTALKQDLKLQHIPVMMCSGLDDQDSIVQCLHLGAEDYIPKPFNKTILKARVEGVLTRKRLRDRERHILAELKRSQDKLQAEIQQAVEYMESLLPQPINDRVKTNWEYIPSHQLGGDGFGYQWLDDDHFALYLLDVCGHGVGSTLLAASACDLLNQAQLRTTDFTQPGEVAQALNDRYKMSERAGKYFTIWYGVYEYSTRQLTYTTCGHPPALLIQNGQVQSLKEGSCAITGHEQGVYPTGTLQVPLGSQLVLFSDGIYEIKYGEHGVCSYSAFFEMVENMVKEYNISPEQLVQYMKDLHFLDYFEDDVSILQVTLNADTVVHDG